MCLALARVSYLWNESLESFLRTRQSIKLEEILCKVLMLRTEKKKGGLLMVALPSSKGSGIQEAGRTHRPYARVEEACGTERTQRWTLSTFLLLARLVSKFVFIPK